MKKKKDKGILKRNVLLGIGLVLVIIAPYIFTLPSFFGISFIDTGQIGTTIGGITAPIIGITGVLVTYQAFLIQYKANVQLRTDIEEDRLESKFFELVGLHKQNVNEIDVAGKYKGRVAFVKMYEELRYVQLLFEHALSDRNEEIPIDDRTEIAYCFFFFGAEAFNNARFQTAHSGERYDLTWFFNVLGDVQLLFEQHKEELLREDKLFKNHPFIPELATYPNFQPSIGFTYRPFEGHITMLGHYYRHLYQTVKFIAGEEKTELDLSEKRSYTKILRAQLSNHEQVLLYYNSYFQPGLVWWKEEGIRDDQNVPLSYFLDLKMIKNIPLNICDFGRRPLERFRTELRDQKGLDGEELENVLGDLLEWY